MQFLPLVLYVFFLSFILLYSFIQLWLLINFMCYNKAVTKKQQQILENYDKTNLPRVTIQLPVYNEKYVVERLIDAVIRIKYPKEKLEIQVLDDSTDESFAIASDKIKLLVNQGIDIKHIKRNNRTGFKAGALAYGLELAKGEFIAIFDADFIPDENFLYNTLPFFQNEKVGCVQTRWGHINKNYSLLTKLQAFALDAHFIIEQTARNWGGYFINFNGTAGIWRKSCIENAGGWSADTLTEDLDLSYRAQLKGWKLVYVKNVVSPAELPIEMNSLKAQQYRWSKGAAECAVKNLKNVLTSKLNISTKIHAFFHLLNSFLFICIFAIGLLSLPVIQVINHYPQWNNFYSLFVIYYAALGIITLFYFVAFYVAAGSKLYAIIIFILLFPLFLSITMGLSLHNAIGVFEAYIKKKSVFVRTPKFNILSRKDDFRKKTYRSSKLPKIVWFEIFFGLYFTFSIYMAIQWNNYLIIPFFLLLAMGFFITGLTSILHYKRK